MTIKFLKNHFIVEQLEPRLLFSADTAFMPLDTAAVYEEGMVDYSVIESALVPGAGSADLQTEAEHQRHEVVFIDSNVQDYEKLVNDILENDNDSRQIDVVLLDSSRDGIEQISESLNRYQDINAVHVVSHGTDGAVELGNVRLSLDTLGTYAESLAGWQDALSNDADLLFYGCDLAAGEDGKVLLDNLKTLTGADVAASDDLTGHSLLGGDWLLEYASGTIETGSAISMDVQQSWFYVMATAASDDFSSGDYSGGSGWTGNWIENGDGDPNLGIIMISAGELLVEEDGAGSVVYREADLSGYGDATLTYDHRGVKDGATSTFTVEVGDGEGNWRTVATHVINSSYGSTPSGNITINANELASDFQIRISSQGIDSSNVLYIDNIQIDYTTGVLTVDTTDDTDDGDTSSISALLANKGADGFISLREAIIATNNTASADEIILPSGTYTLDIDGTGEDTSATGDLDITDDLTITGSGAASTIIDASGLTAADRVFHAIGGDIYMSDLTITNGDAGGDEGGGIFAPSGGATGLTLTNVIITGNTANHGGGIRTSVTTTLTDVEVSGNTASFFGGGIRTDISLTWNGGTLSGNNASNGGGIANIAPSGTIDLTNVTISGNTATSAGGGVYNEKTATLTNLTITDNTANNGGGIRKSGGATTTVTNTIIAGNNSPGDVDVSGAINSLGYNLIGDSAGGSGYDAADILDVSPTLGPLADNGGFTKTHALLGGSRGIDEGTTTGAPAADQRGLARGFDGNGTPNNPQPGDYDIGAYEYYTGATTTMGDGTTPANRNVWGDGKHFGVDSFTLSTDSGTDTLTDLTVTFSGTDVNDVDASGVKIWRDDGAAGNQWDESDTLIGTAASFSGNTATFSGLTESINTTSTQYIVTYNISDTAAAGNTLQGAVTSATVSNTLVNSDNVDATLTVDADMVHETSVYKMVYSSGSVEELYLKNTSSPTTNILNGMSIGSVYAITPGSLIMALDPDMTVTTLVDNSSMKELQMSGRLMHATGASYGTVTTIITFYEDRVIFDVSITMDAALTNEWMFMTYGNWDDALLDESFEWSSNNSGTFNTVDPAIWNTGNQPSPISFQGLFEMGSTDGLVNGTMQNINNFGTSQMKITDDDASPVDIAYQKDNPVLLTTYQASVQYSFDSTTSGFNTITAEERQDDFVTPAALNFGIAGGDGALVGDGYSELRGAYTLDDSDADDHVRFEFQTTTTHHAPAFEITNWNGAAPAVITVDGVVKELGTDYNAAVSGTTLYLQYLGDISANATCEIGDDSISGTVYSDEGTTSIAGKTVRMLVNGVDSGTTTTDANGRYAFFQTLAASDTVLVYIDGNDGVTDDGTTVTVIDGDSLTGLDIYVDHLITRHNNGGVMTNALLDTADGAGGDAEILYSVAGGNLTVSGANTELYIPGSHSFTPGGDVTTSNMENIGTFNGGAGTIDVNGDLLVSGGTYTATSGTTTMGGDVTVSGGAFSHNSGTFVFDSGGSSQTVNSGAAIFNDVTISKGAVSLIVTGTMDVDGDLTITSVNQINTGTIAVSGNVLTTDSSVGGTGTVLFDGAGAQLLSAGGGTGSLPSADINKSGGTLTIQDTINVNGNWTYTAGTVDSGTSTIALTNAGGGQTINSGSMAFNDVTIAKGGVNMTVTGTMDVDGDLTITSVNQINTGTIAVAGNVLTTDASVGGTGTILFDGAGAQLLSGGGGTGSLPSVDINKSGGTLTMQDTINVNNDWTYTAGTVDAGTSTIAFTNTGWAQTVNAGTMAFNDVTVAKGGLTLTVTGTMDVDGDLTITSVGNINTGTITVAGNLTSTDTGVNGTGSITLDGTGIQNIDTTGADLPDGLLTIDKTAGSAILISDMTTALDGGAQDLTINQGTLDLNGFNLTVPDILTLGANGTLQLENGETVSYTTYIPNAGSTVIYDGAGAYTGLKMGNTYSNLVFNGTGTWTLDAALDVNGNLAITSGTLDVDNVGNYQINVAGDWSNSDTYTARTGTVVFDGGDQSLTGSTIFNNFTKIESTNDSTDVTLTFDNTATQTINGILTLDGLDADDRINLVSDSPTNQWSINLTASATKGTMDYLDITDSDASGSDASHITFDPANSIDGGNNIDWFDTTAPTITITSINTNDSTPGLSGTIDDTTATININIDGNNYAATNNGDGTWTLADNTIAALAEGVYEVVATATDTVGNAGVDGSTNEVDIDLTAPTITITSINTNDSTPGLSGTIDDTTATININIDGNNYAATNNGDGTWTLADNTIAALAEGVYEVVATATDTVGNAGVDGSTNEVDIDLTAPTITITSINTNDSTPGLSGTIDDTTATININIDGNNYAATNNGDGTWTLADNTIAALAEGVYEVVATATDTVGNAGVDGSTNEVDIDLTAPTITITSINTNDSTPGLSGTIDDTTATININIDGNNYAATNNGDGTWTLADNTIAALAEGVYEVVATATDTVGNAGVDGSTNEVDIDLTAPTITITSINTNDSTPGLSGTIDDTTATININIDGNNYAATNNGDGTWTLADNTIAPALADGVWEVAVTATDGVGNAGSDATANELTVDTTAPTVTVNLLSTNDTTPQLTGTVNDTAATIQVTVNGNNYAATNNGDGTWTLADNTIAALAEGVYEVVATATDTVGNAGVDGSTNEVDIDLTAPTITITSINTNDSTPGLSGTINDTTATININIDGNNYAATNNGDGTWTLADNTIAPALADGVWEVAVTATDGVGNAGSDATANELTVDTTAPTVTVNLLTTGDSTPALTGTVNDTAATIQVTVNGNNYAATNNGDGTWTLADNTIAPALADGVWEVAVTATDGVGNAGSDATANELTVNINDAPTASNLNMAETYNVDTPLNLTDIVVSDVDSANVTVTITISDIAAGSLSTGTSGAVTSTFVAGVWTASGAIADVNILLAGITFSPASGYNSNFTIATSVDDGIAPAISGVKNMIVASSGGGSTEDPPPTDESDDGDDDEDSTDESETETNLEEEETPLPDTPFIPSPGDNAATPIQHAVPSGSQMINELRKASERDLELSELTGSNPAALNNISENPDESVSLVSEFYTSLELSGESIDKIVEKESIVTKAFVGVTMSLSVGAAAWILRAGSLVASAISSIPLWKGFDPLPVLPFSRTEKRKKMREVRRSENAERRKNKEIADIFDSETAEIMINPEEADKS